MNLKEEFELLRQKRQEVPQEILEEEGFDFDVDDDVEEYDDLDEGEYFVIDDMEELIMESSVDTDPEDFDDKEIKEIEGFNILILTSSRDSKNNKMSKKNPTILKVEKYCKEHDIPYYTAFADTAYLEKQEEGVLKIYNIDDKEGHEIDRDKTIVFARRGIMFHRYSQNLMSRLEKYRFCFLNEKHAIQTCEDKYLTNLRLVEAGLPLPKFALVPTEEMIEIAFQKIGGKFPVVVKTLNGTQGRGVFIVSDYRSLKSTLQALWATSDSVEMMLQEFIKSDFDTRIHVLGDKVIAAMKRKVIENDFRSNVHLGGKTGKFAVTKEVAKIAIKASKAVKCKWSGVDIMFDKKGKPYILEVNASPGTDGIEAITGKNIVEMVITYLKNVINWARPAQEVGVLETLEIAGIGEIFARFDTGNGAGSCSLDAQDVKVNGNVVTWKTQGKKMKASLYGKVFIKNNQGADEDRDSRPIVSLDVTFEGVTYKDVPFNLNDRSHKSAPVLVDKDFIIRSGSVVNPSKIFSVTNEPDGFDKKKVKKKQKDPVKKAKEDEKQKEMDDEDREEN